VAVSHHDATPSPAITLRTPRPRTQPDDGRGTLAGRALAEVLVRPVVVEMALVLVKDGASGSFVVDQEPVGALRTDTADESLGIAIRLRSPGRDLDQVEAFGAKTASKASVNFASRSRIRKRNALIRSPRSISRLGAIWAVQAAVGCAVTPKQVHVRVRTSITHPGLG
jgi:hypothetical protein